MKVIKVLISTRFQIAVICVSLLFVTSCTKKYAEINTDRNTIATIGSAELPFLLREQKRKPLQAFGTTRLHKTFLLISTHNILHVQQLIFHLIA